MAKNRVSYRLTNEDLENIAFLAEQWTGITGKPNDTQVISTALRLAREQCEKAPKKKLEYLS